MRNTINTLRQYQTKTRQAKLLQDRIEIMQSKIKLLLKDEDEDVKGFEGAVKRMSKGKPNELHRTALAIIDEIQTLQSHKGLKQYLENTTKSKK